MGLHSEQCTLNVIGCVLGVRLQNLNEYFEPSGSTVLFAPSHDFHSTAVHSRPSAARSISVKPKISSPRGACDRALLWQNTKLEKRHTSEPRHQPSLPGQCRRPPIALDLHRSIGNAVVLAPCFVRLGSFVPKSAPEFQPSATSKTTRAQGGVQSPIRHKLQRSHRRCSSELACPFVRLTGFQSVRRSEQTFRRRLQNQQPDPPIPLNAVRAGL